LLHRQHHLELFLAGLYPCPGKINHFMPQHSSLTCKIKETLI
jgi:hypothetical protein